MYAVGLECRSCGRRYPIETRYACECGGIVNVIYDYQNPQLRPAVESALGSGPSGSMWRFGCLLPVQRPEAAVSLGEGGTPLLQAARLGPSLGLDALYLKVESANPTASFKDRPTSVGVSVAKEAGARGIIIASSGNAGAATGAYAARAGLPSVVVMPEGTPAAKVAQARACGAMVVATRGSYATSYKLAKAAAAAFGWVNVSSTFLNPYTLEGDKTVAYELWLQLGRRVPDWVIVPIGAGPLLVGILKGFEELRLLGFSDRVPRMVGVQSEAVHPVVDAFAAGEDTVAEWLGSTRTVSSGIADPLVGYAADGTATLAAIRASGGHCTMAPDEETLDMGRALARSEGVFVEPTAATAVVAAAELAQQGVIPAGDVVVAMMTGHGLKTPLVYERESGDVPVVESPEELLALWRAAHPRATI